MSKKIFMIAVTDEENSLNRKYTESVYKLLEKKFSSSGYIIDIHYKLPVSNLRQSITDALTGNTYEGFIVLLDCLEKEIYDPNVMFELGAIFYLNKPFVVLSSYTNRNNIPFDISDINIIKLPEEMVKYIETNYKGNLIDVYEHFCNYFTTKSDKSDIDIFLERIYDQYIMGLKGLYNRENEIKNIGLRDIWQEIKDVKELVSNTAEYIDGEEAAFIALTEAVNNAKISLRTTRFANESIVKDNAILAQKNFMKALYSVSEKISNNFNRIICNNDPAKWQDIYDILLYGENGVKVYVRKRDFSIHFELVIIDETVAFIHFYQQDREKKEESSNKNNEEKIKSTLKIQGSSICQKLTNIFDRLHHRDFLDKNPKEPSRTLLGIPSQDENYKEEYKDYGSFEIKNNVKRYSSFSRNTERRAYIIQMFKRAFKEWKIDNHIDKKTMLVGIALIEENDNFIEEMKERFKDDEYKEIKNLYTVEMRKKNN